MALKEKHEPLFGLIFFDQLLFSTWFWRKDLSLPMSTKQKMMYNDLSEKRLNCTGRKTAKTILLESRVVRESCIHRGVLQEPDEALLFFPGDTHRNPVRDRIVSRFDNHVVFQHFLEKYNKNEDILLTKTGLLWNIKIEGTSGKETNMVGFRTIFIFGDELAFGNQACETGRKQTALPGCQWMYCGVPNGVRNSPFFELDQTHLGDAWSRHKLTSLDNPMYAHEYGSMEEAIAQLEKEYGNKNSQGFVTQVLGKWGEEAYSAFPPSMIASRRELPFFIREYMGAEIEGAIQRNDLETLFRIPRVNAQRYAIGVDFGYAQDPAIIMVAYETHNDAYDRSEWLQLARLKFRQTSGIHQAKCIDFLNRVLFNSRVQAIACDKYDVLTALTNTDEADSLGHKDNYAEKTFCSQPQGTMIITDSQGDPILDEKGKPVTMRTKQWMTEQLRKAMSYANSNLPHQFDPVPNIKNHQPSYTSIHNHLKE